MRWYEKIGNQLFEPNRRVTPGELIFFKFFELFILLYTIYYSWSWGLYTKLHNSEVVLSLGLANYFDVSYLFDHNIPLFIAFLTSILGIFGFFRKGPKWLYAVVFFLLHLQYVIRYSQGEIPHSQNMIGLSVFCLAVGSIFFSDKQKMPRFVLGAIIFFVGLGYTSAFFSKLIGTGFNWFDGRHLWLWISEKSVDILSREGSFQLNFLQQLALSSTLLSSMILLFGWLTELIGFTAWWKKLRPYTISLLILMHFGITLSMNIRFDAFVLELILIGFPWYKMIDRSVSSTPAWIQKMV
ncbi:hypothetical protein [Rhodohalobacter sulfatireducens]|uniref:HTTM domain-containing protein n=1 Tax=Rhodohalobacter sulfatireducens TaxID=2911366 RepID=A0ABS9KI32_9BACT|nr:hypothetical protein [Rhodohalobacter sulfatireducens]MCG2590516.1 hypothetical protein [Rhodohalobacter sulfatireducens]MDR9417284.1 hypothetical protein [Gracilimonas sp.]